MDLCNQSCSSVANTLDITLQTCQPIFFIPAMLIAAVDFYHFCPLFLTLTLAWDHRVRAKQILLALFSCTLFN